MSFLEIALECAARGWYVFPCWPETKKPMTKHGWHDASADPIQLNAWWAKTPNANVAIACGPSDLAVLDIDKGLPDDVAALLWLGSNGIPATYMVRTGRRPNFGLQIYFVGAISDVGLWQLNGCEGQVKSAGGYVMAAGCIHPESKKTYTVKNDAPLAPTPDVVRALKTFQLPVKPTGPMDKIPEGAGRHAALTSIAGKLRASGLDRDAIYNALVPINPDVCEVPISDADLAHIADSVGRYALPESVPVVTIGKQPTPDAPIVPVDWREHYHTSTEHDNVGPPTFLIENFLPEQSIMGIGAFVGQKKTLAALNVAHSLCSGEPLFGRYKVIRKPARVLYLGPENGLISFSDRVNRIGLRPFLCDTFFYSTMSMQEPCKLANLQPDEIRDAVIFIDTAIRFTEGSENDAAAMKTFAAIAFALIRAQAAGVVMLHHSPKSMTTSRELTLDNSFRGTGELSAFLSVALAMRTQNMEDEYGSPSLLRFVKQRDFEPKPASFEVMTSRETCRMEFVDGSDGASVKINMSDKDGKEEDAIQFIRDNPDMPIRDVVLNLREMGIKRGKTWVSDKRYDVLGKGTKTSVRSEK